MSYDIVEHSRQIQQLLESEVPFVVVTLIDIRGSAPQVVGAKGVVTADGIVGGTVGGGKVEAASIAHAQQLLRQAGKHNDWVTWNLQTDVGMTCGGEVKLFFEVHTHTTWPIVVFGAGHISQAVVRLLLTLHCHVTCIDTRSEWLEKLPKHPKLHAVLADTPHELVAAQPDNAYFALMSQGHATDLPVLAEVLKTRQAPYVGVIGSRQKASVLRRDLKALELPPEVIESFHCPMGLDLGNNTPAEIAISIVAQLLQHRDGGI
ncbi:MAG: xanthine dehydrogenase accessory protein XdhC [Planctomycetales bacterium]|nr:xanthine dehydrogenase accessory protein XdhC [Planctomycetales bacterium]